MRVQTHGQTKADRHIPTERRSNGQRKEETDVLFDWGHEDRQTCMFTAHIHAHSCRYIHTTWKSDVKS